MSEEIKDVLDGLGKGFEEFKTENQKRLDEIEQKGHEDPNTPNTCLLYTSPSPRDGLLSRMPSSA